MSEIKPRLPAVGEYLRTIGRLVEVEKQPPVEPPTDYIFESVEYPIELWANGKLVDERSIYNDFYGDGTGLESAIKHAKYVHKEYGGVLDVRVYKVTQRARYRPKRDELFYDSQFFDFDQLEYGCKIGMPDDVRELVWSSASANSTDANRPRESEG